MSIIPNNSWEGLINEDVAIRSIKLAIDHNIRIPSFTYKRIIDLTRALGSSPNRVQIYLLSYHSKKQEHDQVIRSAMRMGLNASDPKIARMLALAYVKTGLYQEAINTLNEIENKKRPVWYHIIRSDAFIGLSLFEDALLECEEARKFNPFDEKIRKRAIKSFEGVYSKNGAESSRHLGSLEDWIGGNWNSLPNDFRILQSIFRFDREHFARFAIAFLRRVRSASQRIYLLAMYCNMVGRVTTARILAKKYVERHPDNIPAITLAARICYRASRWEEDELVFRNAVARLPIDQRETSDAIAVLHFLRNVKAPAAEELSDSCAITNFIDLIRHLPPSCRDQVPVHVAMFGNSLAPGGAERILAKIFYGLAKSGNFDSVKLHIKDLYSKPQHAFYLNLIDEYRQSVSELQETFHQANFLASMPGALGQDAASIFSALHRERPDVAYFTLDQLNLAGALAAVSAGVPRIILHCHNMRPETLGYPNHAIEGWRKLYHGVLERSDVTLVHCCKTGLGDYLDWTGADPTRATYIYNGFDFPERTFRDLDKLREATRSQFGLKLGAPVIGSVMRVADVKQPEIWVMAARRIKAQMPEAQFIIFGDGPNLPALKGMVSDFGLEDDFVLPGNVYDIADKLPALDLLMLTSKSEGLPNSLIEAQSCGVPVLAFDVGGVREAMDHGVTGITTAIGDGLKIAERAVSLLRQDDWRQRARKLGPQFVKKQFSSKRMIREFQALIQKG